MKVGIIGLGYVGLPLVIQFAKSGTQVVGIDVDEGKIEATIDFFRVKKLDAILICVLTPLGDKRESV